MAAMARPTLATLRADEPRARDGRRRSRRGRGSGTRGRPGRAARLRPSADALHGLLVGLDRPTSGGPRAHRRGRPRPRGTGATHGVDGRRPGSRTSSRSSRRRPATHARRGAPLAAAELWELSADLTPPDDEALLCSRRRSAALERFDAGDVQRGRTMLEDLIGATTSRQQQAWTRVELATRSYNDADRVDELVRTALPDVGDHPILLPVAHANLAWVAICRLEPSRAADHARTAAELAERGSDPTPLRVALTALAQAEALLGMDPWPTIDRAVAIAADLAPGETTQPERIRGHHMLWEGRIAEAQRSIKEADLHLVRGRSRAHAPRHPDRPLRGGVRRRGMGRRRSPRGRGIRHRRASGPRRDPGSDAVREGARRVARRTRRRGARRRIGGSVPRRRPGQPLDGGREPQRARVHRALGGRPRRRRPCSRPGGSTAA